MDRRSFLKSSAGALGVAAVSSFPILQTQAAKSAVSSETLVTTLYKSLNQNQRETIVFPFNDPLRKKVVNNWHITKPRVGKDFTADQQEMIRQIFLGIHSEEYAEAVLKQVAEDSEKKGLEDTSIALFGEPGEGKFEFVLTGRHVTRRCDGDSVEGAAFGGPIFYGHQSGPSFNEGPAHPGNIYWYQAKRANELYTMLDGKQRKTALLGQGRKEQATKTVKLTGKNEDLPGIRASELSRDQKRHLRKVVEDVLMPFRQEDVSEAMNMIKKGGIDNLHLAFFKDQDLGNDGVWDVWQIEGPNMVMFFRGEPHVHAYLHIRDTIDA
ncbi:MAG TPA: DUF3500 domain-containing protein [Verrucomicrobiales bacterium]|nr:DUF3500 domain-containing protein [Verrucomicrobiales bacterium]